MAYVDFQRSRYLFRMPKSGINVRLLCREQPSQVAYIGPLFEYSLDVSPTNANGDFKPNGASLEEVEGALQSTSGRVRMRAIITLCSRGNVSGDTLRAVALMQSDKGEFDYEFGKTYGSSRFCPTVSVCARIFWPVLAHNSPRAMMALISGMADASESQRYELIAALKAVGPEAISAVAVALAIEDPTPSTALRDAARLLSSQSPAVSSLISYYQDEVAETKAENIMECLAKASVRFELNDFLTTLIEAKCNKLSWIARGLRYQADGKLCLQLAQLAGADSVSYLTKGLASSNKQARLACAYAIPRIAPNSSDARFALKTAVQSEHGIFAKWHMGRYLKAMN